MDTSSELIHSLLPVFLVSGLGASALSVGLIEGVAESTALIVKVFSGTLSDWLGKRKLLAVLGYGLAAACKPLFALASSVEAVLAARFLDRIGKGIRGAPRDALVADVTPHDRLGAAYGLRQAMDTVGAFLGPLAALALMAALGGDFRKVFWWSALPAVLAVLLLSFGVSETAPAREKPKSPIRREALRELGAAYWKVVAVGSVFTLARFSEAFLILRGRQAGLSDAQAPLVFVLMNVVYAVAAFPAGRLADAVKPRRVLAAGLVTLAAADALLAWSGGLAGAAAGVALWGVHMALTQGVLSAMVAKTAPGHLRGTAFGVFNLASGLVMLVSSPLAGLLWERVGPAAAFYAGGAFSLATPFSRRRPRDAVHQKGAWRSSPGTNSILPAPMRPRRRLVNLLLLPFLAVPARAGLFHRQNAVQKRGAEIYARMCAVCHGAQGEGYKADRAPALANPAFLGSATDAFLLQAINEGRAGTTMSAWSADRGGPLASDDALALLAFIRGWDTAKHPALDERPLVATATARGAELYALQCQRCHGAGGVGGPYESLGSPGGLKNASDGFLRLAIREGRNDTPMAAFAGPLGDAGVEDVVALLRQWQAQAPPPLAPPRPAPLPLGPVPLNAKGPEPEGFNAFPALTRVDAVKAQLDRGARMAILDARAPGDYAQEHIAGAVSVPFYDPAPYLDLLPKDSWLVCYCACPHAESGQLAQKLEANGFSKVTVLDEGFIVWKKKGYPVRAGRQP